MSFLSLGTTLMHILMNNVIPLLFVLGIVVFVHEFGHFIVGRLCGVGVWTFSMGFGPELFGFNDRKGTRWRIAAVPLGGYVKFYGDQNAAGLPDDAALAKMSPQMRSRSLPAQPVWARALIVAAGPVANFILAVAIFSATAFFYGKQTLTPRIERVQPASAAATAGFLPGDLVLQIDGQPIPGFAELQQVVSTHPGKSLTFVVDRGGRELTLTATPVLTDTKTPFGHQNIGLLGVYPSSDPRDLHYTYPSVADAVGSGISDTFGLIEKTLGYVVGILTGRESASQLSGPLGIGQAVGVVASWGLVPLFNFMALMSVSIGLINLFPIPILDGGHLLFFAIEASRGRPLSERTQEMGFRMGLAFVVALMLFVTVNDSWRIFS
ncbi:MAG: RIP metalloprotease [Hyphomicrobiales bacterium]|nr:RIP metalloprotease [Hyphomicrobiales bacterium]MBV9520382.1 RIP metalloprotease [Hyphomicrobiales bacterium]